MGGVTYTYGLLLINCILILKYEVQLQYNIHITVQIGAYPGKGGHCSHHRTFSILSDS